MDYVNALTGREYRGKNSRFCMAAQPYTSNQWAGFDQWMQLGRVVREGQKSIAICRPQKVVSKEGREFMRYPAARVFNFEQTEPMSAEAKTAYLGRKRKEDASAPEPLQRVEPAPRRVINPPLDTPLSALDFQFGRVAA